MASRPPDPDRSDDLVSEFGENATYVAELLARYRTNPDAVDPDWRGFFEERYGPASAAAAPASDVSPAAAPPPPAAPPASAPPAAPAAPALSAAARDGEDRAPIRGADEERAPIRGAALRIAQNMEASLGVPTATSQRQIPIRLADENRRLVNDYRTANELSKVSFTHLIGWAVLQGLKAFPRLNDGFEDAGGAPTRVRRERIGFGLAVDVEKSDGTRTLLVPNVPGAERMSFSQFTAAVDEVIARARSGKLQVSDFAGTTVSLTNPGTLGTTASVPRLMPGQGLIVATGAIEYPAEFSAAAPDTLSRLAISKVFFF